MEVAIIGSGNVAQAFARLIDRSQHQLISIICRNATAWDAVWNDIQPVPVYGFGSDPSPAGLYIAAVSDQFLPDLHKHLKIPPAIIVHTAGSVPAHILKTLSTRYGVLYPLQTLRKENSLLPPVPLLIDGSDQETLSDIETFARSLSATVERVGDELRQKMHIAAVSSSNFINHLLTLVTDYCKAEGLNARLLLPLWEETIHRLELFEPAYMQTGPAIRNDSATIRNHLEKLSHYPDLQQVYHIFSESIMRYYNKKDGGTGQNS